MNCKTTSIGGVEMSVLQIDEIDLGPALQAIVKEAAAEEAKKIATDFIEEYKKKLDAPRAMNYTQAAKYLDTSYNTLTKKLIRKGYIKVVLIDGYERITREEADRFLRENSK